MGTADVVSYSSRKKTGGTVRDVTFKQLQYIEKTVLQPMMKHIYAYPFIRPVDVVALGLTDYHDVIKHPMDLGTIQNKLKKRLYPDVRSCLSDFQLMFSNCRRYNNATDDIVLMCQQLEELFHKKVSKMKGRVPTVIIVNSSAVNVCHESSNTGNSGMSNARVVNTLDRNQSTNKTNHHAVHDVRVSSQKSVIRGRVDAATTDTTYDSPAMTGGKKKGVKRKADETTPRVANFSPDRELLQPYTSRTSEPKIEGSPSSPGENVPPSKRRKKDGSDKEASRHAGIKIVFERECNQTPSESETLPVTYTQLSTSVSVPVYVGNSVPSVSRRETDLSTSDSESESNATDDGEEMREKLFLELHQWFLSFGAHLVKITREEIVKPKLKNESLLYRSTSLQQQEAVANRIQQSSAAATAEDDSKKDLPCLSVAHHHAAPNEPNQSTPIFALGPSSLPTPTPEVLESKSHKEIAQNKSHSGNVRRASNAALGRPPLVPVFRDDINGANCVRRPSASSKPPSVPQRTTDCHRQANVSGRASPQTPLILSPTKPHSPPLLAGLNLAGLKRQASGLQMQSSISESSSRMDEVGATRPQSNPLTPEVSSAMGLQKPSHSHDPPALKPSFTIFPPISTSVVAASSNETQSFSLYPALSALPHSVDKPKKNSSDNTKKNPTIKNANSWEKLAVASKAGSLADTSTKSVLAMQSFEVYRNKAMQKVERDRANREQAELRNKTRLEQKTSERLKQEEQTQQVAANLKADETVQPPNNADKEQAEAQKKAKGKREEKSRKVRKRPRITKEREIQRLREQENRRREASARRIDMNAQMEVMARFERRYKPQDLV